MRNPKNYLKFNNIQTVAEHNDNCEDFRLHYADFEFLNLWIHVKLLIVHFVFISIMV